jgi:hypothetical protein
MFPWYGGGEMGVGTSHAPGGGGVGEHRHAPSKFAEPRVFMRAAVPALTPHPLNPVPMCVSWLWTPAHSSGNGGKQCGNGAGAGCPRLGRRARRRGPVGRQASTGAGPSKCRAGRPPWVRTSAAPPALFLRFAPLLPRRVCTTRPAPAWAARVSCTTVLKGVTIQLVRADRPPCPRSRHPPPPPLPRLLQHPDPHSCS